MAFDLDGAARDLDERARRHAPIFAAGGPEFSAAVRLLHRNPWLGPAIKAAIEAEMARHPEQAVGLEAPLFDAQGRWAQREGA